ncbi:MAG: alanyl-tRNA editing protein [Candidatus Methanoplasma sp.]|jgi:alanyl-tRNA synthetase|nr:alanyl-tRNA editing protein [Candidatus Methanoplasma sp.]
MTDEIFRRDGYAFEFEAEVVFSEGDIVELDSTAFYPGGGGQVCDTGTIRGIRVTEAFYKGGNVLHRVVGNDLKVGERVWCSVDWDRRYELMKGHTGEHLLFCALKRQDPELTITKISIADDDNSVIVDHDPGWENIGRALEFANQAIRDNLPVTKSIMSRDDPELANVRIKLDRISKDEEISVVSIGDIAQSA